MTDKELIERAEALFKLDAKRTQGDWRATECMDVWVQAGEIGVAQTGDIRWEGQSSVVNTEEQMKDNGRFIAAAPEMMSLIRDLLTAYKALREASQWRDIESAPKDGSEVIVYRPLASNSGDKEIAIKRTVSYNNSCWQSTVPEGREAVNYTDGACYPTHWMPLPAAPTEQSTLKGAI